MQRVWEREIEGEDRRFSTQHTTFMCVACCRYLYAHSYVLYCISVLKSQIIEPSATASKHALVARKKYRTCIFTNFSIASEQNKKDGCGHTHLYRKTSQKRHKAVKETRYKITGERAYYIFWIWWPPLSLWLFTRAKYYIDIPTWCRNVVKASTLKRNSCPILLCKGQPLFLTIFIAYQCKVHRVVARKLHPSLPCAGKNYAWANKCPEMPYNKTPVRAHNKINYPSSSCSWQYEAGFSLVYRCTATSQCTSTAYTAVFELDIWRYLVLSLFSKVSESVIKLKCHCAVR